VGGRDARVAVVGATGTVGSQIAELLGTRSFPLAELKLFGRDSSSQAVESGERTLPVARFDGAADIARFDIAFLAIERTHAGEIIAARPGPVLIDLSAATIKPDSATPLLSPGVSPRERIAALAPAKVFGVPHPAAQVIAGVLKAIGGGGFAGATVMLSASAGGHQVISELFQQSADLLNAKLDLAEDQSQIAFNVFPAMHGHELSGIIAAQVSALIGYASALAIQIVRVPAFHGSAVALFIPGREDSGEWAERLRAFPGLILVESNESSGFADAAGQEAVIVSVSQTPAGVAVWCVFDAARLAALTAIWLGEAVISEVS
jgi:aspartate-semialdehyde dehydrogenase